MRPQKTHVALAKDAERENARRQVAVDQRFVVQFLAADGFDAQQFRARRRRAFKQFQHRVPIAAAPHQRRALKFAVVVGRHAQHALQAAAVLFALHAFEQDLRDVQTPLRMFGHGRQRLKLDDDTRHFQIRRAAQRAFDDLFVVAPHLRHGAGVNGHRRQREVQFRINRAAANHHAAARGDGFGREAEDQFQRVGNGERFVVHGDFEKSRVG